MVKFEYCMSQGGYKVTKVISDEEVVSIPKRYKGKKVWAIASNVLAVESPVTHLILPKSVIVVEKNAFKGCKNLQFVSVGKLLTILDDGAFLDCVNLETLVLKHTSLVTIGSGCFKHCTKLSGIELPDTVTQIGVAAFCGCEELSEFKNPEKNKIITDFTFLGCKQLSEVFIDKNVLVAPTAFSGTPYGKEVSYA